MEFNRDAVLREWLERTLRSYPEQSARFLLGEKDPFRNPVGQAYRDNLPVLLDWVTGTGDPAAALEGILRMRAVEERTPGEAVSFVFLLKELVPERAQRIDELALRAFDVYMRCRERLWEIRMRSRQS